MKKRASDIDSHEEFLASVKQGSFSPVYLFHGEEDFLIDEALDTLAAAAVDESTRSFNFDILYGSESDANKVVACASAFPMMAERRMVIVREFEKLSDKDALIPYVERPSPSTVLALVSSKTDFREKLYKSIAGVGVVVEFKSLYNNQIPAWIARRIEKLGKKITPEAGELMALHVRGSMREIQNEIDKLFVFVGDKERIDDGDVNAVVGMSKEFNIFELQKWVGLRDLRRCVEIMERMLDAGENGVHIVVMLTRYFQKLWLLQELRTEDANEYQLAQSIHVSPFFLKEYLAAAKNLPSEQIEQCFDALVEADESLKSTPTAAKLIMTRLLYRCLGVDKSGSLI